MTLTWRRQDGRLCLVLPHDTVQWATPMEELLVERIEELERRLQPWGGS